MNYCRVPYWSIIIPLTALSAYLLLVPQKTKAKPQPEVNGLRERLGAGTSALSLCDDRLARRHGIGTMPNIINHHRGTAEHLFGNRLHL